MARLRPELLAAVAARTTEGTGRADVGDAVARYLADTAERTVQELPDGTTYVITGDIPAMWLRDSAAQLTPLLYLLDDAPELVPLIAGLLRRHWYYICIDPYANAFNIEPNGRGHRKDKTRMHPIVWERKFEIDSLSYGLVMAHRLWTATGDTSWCDERFAEAARRIVVTFTAEQDHEDRSSYRFRRGRFHRSSDRDTLTRCGKGRRTRPVGLVWSGFRPSDDACEEGFNIPGNHYAALAMRRLADIARTLLDDDALATEAERLDRDITSALALHQSATAPDGSTVIAYETDGAGRHVLMDDANVPSLLSLPYLGCVAADDPLYVATRRFVLSSANPYHYSGRVAAGVGSPHTPRDHVWPIALSVQGLSSTDPDERAHLLDLLLATTAGTGMMHESFHVDDPSRFTRDWFSWANAMFCELAMVHSGLSVPVRNRPSE